MKPSLRPLLVGSALVMASSGRYGRCNRLNVLYFPFFEATSTSATSASVVAGFGG